MPMTVQRNRNRDEVCSCVVSVDTGNMTSGFSVPNAGVSRTKHVQGKIDEGDTMVGVICAKSEGASNR